MKIVFGRNRRQKPIELLCEQGKVTISRDPHGVIRVSLVAENARLEEIPAPSFVKTFRMVKED